MTIRANISSPIKAGVAKHVRSGGNLPWSYSVSTPGTDVGKITWAANAAYAVNTGALSFWAKVPTVAGIKVFAELYSSAGERTSLYASSNALIIAYVRGGSGLLNNTISFTNDGGWHHYVMTWDSASYDVYVDGVRKFTSAANYVMNLTTPQISLGGALSVVAPTAGNYLGLSIYNAKLSALNVTGLYNSNQIPSSCVGRWDFEKGIGSSIPQTFGPNANSGALGTGGAWTTIVPAGKTRLVSNGILVGGI